MDEQNQIAIGFDLDIPGLKQELSEAEQLMQQGVQRMNNLQQGETPTVITSPQGAPPPVPPPPVPTPPTGGSATTAPPPPVPPSPTSGSAVTAAQEELEQIRQLSAAAPDVALAALSGRGGLLGRVQRGAIASPDQAEEYQELLEGISELTKSIRANTRQAEDSDTGGPAAGLLGFLRQNAIAGMAGNIGGQLAGGNVIGAGAQALGGALGFIFGGPAGAMAGATVGAMGAGAITSFLGGAGESQDYLLQSTDIAARFGDVDMANRGGALGVDAINAMDTSGFNVQETAGLFDLLRQTRLADGIDDESRALVESLQALTRATGMNTEALVQSYASYRTLGGEGDAMTFQAQMIAGAIQTGMRQNLAEYQELVGSARMQLVYQGGVGDQGDGALRGIQGTLGLLLNQQNRFGDLLRDNPMMAQQIMGNLFQTGASRSVFGADSSLMQLAGISASATTEGYITPERRIQNSLQRQEFIARNFLQQATGIMGFGGQEQLFSAAQANPNLVQDLLSDRNPNTQQARVLQEQLDVQISTALGKPLEALTAQDRTTTMQMLQAFITNGGSLAPETVTADGKSLGELLAETQKSEGQQAREAAQERHDQLMGFMDTFKGLLTEIDRVTADVLTFLNGTLKPAIQDELIPALQAINATLAPLGSLLGAGANVAGTVAMNPQEVITEGANNFLRQQLPSAPQAIRQGIAGTTGGITGMGVETLIRMSPFGGAVDLARNFAQFFDDTPDSGVLVEPGRETFRFAPGDRVYAAPDLSRMAIAGAGGQSINATINVNLSVPAGADAEWMRGAAQSGTQSGLDEFMNQWVNQNRQVNPRQARSLY